MKFIHIFLNYLRFFFKQGSTFWLTLLYPIMLILLVGIGLNIGTATKPTIIVFGNDSIFDTIGQDPNFFVLTADSPQMVEAKVVSKEAIMGIVVEKNDSRKVVNIYIDPTKQAVASNLLLLVDKAVNEEKMKSGQSLSAIQQKLAPSLIDMKQKKTELKQFETEIDGVRSNITQTKQELISTKAKLASYKSELIAYKSNLSRIDYFQNKLTGYDANLSSFSNTLYARQSERDSVSYKLSDNIYKINGYLFKVDNVRNYISYAKSYSTSYNTNYYLDQMDGELLSLHSDLLLAQSDMTNAKYQLDSIDFYSMQVGISNIRSDITSTKNDLALFKTGASVKIDSMISEIDTSDVKVSSAIANLTAFESKLISLKTKTFDTGVLLERMIVPLEEFLGKKPEELLPPQINSISVFPNEKKIDMFFPGILGIDMILASLLLPMIMKVRMREQGVELRMILSKAGTMSVIIGEMLANYCVSLFQLLLIFIFGILFFGIRVGNPVGFFVVFFTLPLVFTSLGVFLSQIINRSSTAFLLSLLISIPMIFISGTIIPLEFLNPVIAFVGHLTPLYILIDFTEKSFFRSVSTFEVLIDYAYLLIFTIGNIFLAMVAYYSKR
jgi:ABC-type transport system involved in cytochrome c biogenesis permease component